MAGPGAALRDGLWDTSAVLSDMGPVGGVVAALTGYRAQPSLMTVLVFGGYWVLVFALMRWRGAVQARAMTATHGRAGAAQP